MVKEKFILEDVTTIEDIKKSNVSFEVAYSKIEEIVKMQEQGNMNLTDSRKYYKLGKLLTEYCEDILNNAKLEIERISNE